MCLDTVVIAGAVPSENPYAKGSGPWSLFGSATGLAREPTPDDDQANAMDRRTVALYKTGAEWRPASTTFPDP